MKKPWVSGYPLSVQRWLPRLIWVFARCTSFCYAGAHMLKRCRLEGKQCRSWSGAVWSEDQIRRVFDDNWKVIFISSPWKHTCTLWVLVRIASVEYPQHMFLWRNKQNYLLIIRYLPYKSVPLVWSGSTLPNPLSEWLGSLRYTWF